jgi:hypothetical protein
VEVVLNGPHCEDWHDALSSSDANINRYHYSYLLLTSLSNMGLEKVSALGICKSRYSFQQAGITGKAAN